MELLISLSPHITCLIGCIRMTGLDEIRKKVIAFFCKYVPTLQMGQSTLKLPRKKHKSVSDVKNKPGCLNQGVFNTAVWNLNVWNFGGLFVYLDGEAADNFGSMIGVIDLAKKILDHWESDPRLSP